MTKVCGVIKASLYDSTASYLVGITFTFIFSRRFYPKRLTISTFVRRKRISLTMLTHSLYTTSWDKLLQYSLLTPPPSSIIELLSW